MYLFYPALRYLKDAFQDGNNFEVVEHRDHTELWLENVQIRVSMWLVIPNLAMAPATVASYATQLIGDLLLMAIRDVRTAIDNISASRGPSPTTAVNVAQSRLKIDF